MSSLYHQASRASSARKRRCTRELKSGVLCHQRPLASRFTLSTCRALARRDVTKLTAVPFMLSDFQRSCVVVLIFVLPLIRSSNVDRPHTRHISVGPSLVHRLGPRIPQRNTYGSPHCTQLPPTLLETASSKMRRRLRATVAQIDFWHTSGFVRGL